MLKDSSVYRREVRDDAEHQARLWREYERRKRVIAALGLTPREYGERIQDLCRELGI